MKEDAPFNDSFDQLRSYFIQIENILERQKHVLVTGPAGIGKTTLLDYFQQHIPARYKSSMLIKGRELENDSDILTLFKRIIALGQTLLIIDGYDEIIRDDIKQSLLNLFKEGRKYGLQVMMSARSQSDLEPFIPQAEVVRIVPFAEELAKRMLTYLLQQQQLNYEDIQTLLSAVPELKYSPLAIDQLKILMLRYGNLKNQIILPLHSGINYQSSLLNIAGNDSLIIQPARQQLITEIKLIEKDFLALVRNQPDSIYDLTPREFEELVADLYKKKGFDVLLTKATRDGGKDFIISNKGLLGNQLLYGECKQHRRDRPVGIGAIKQLHSTVVTDKATGGIVVTSSYFSPAAEKFADGIQHQMTLVDFVALNKMIQEIV